MSVEPPDLPELRPFSLEDAGAALDLDGAQVDGGSVSPTGIAVVESVLTGVSIDAPHPRGFKLRDARLTRCDLSNVDGEGGSLTRVTIDGSRLMGFRLSSGTVRDLRIDNSSLALSSFAFADLRNVIFDSVNFSDASFMDAKLHSVEFRNCELAGADFRRATLKDCTMRGTSLDGIQGLGSLSGLRMPWPDIVNSAGVLAEALGIEIAD